MLKKHSVEGFDAFKSKVEELSKEGLPLFVHFSGSKENGKKFQIQSSSSRILIKAIAFTSQA